ncbi:MAG: ABC transporter permease, partial [Natronospirillum sp.]
MSVTTTRETQPGDAPDQSSDERVRNVSIMNKLLSRPELGSVSGAILVFIFFILVAGDSGMFSPSGILNWSTVSAQLGIIAIGACMLMIGGEFDLSTGVMVGTTGLLTGVLVTELGLDLWTSIFIVIIFAAGVGLLN